MNYRFGRLPARQDPRTPRFAAYLTPQLPPAPAAVSILALVEEKLGGSRPINELFPVDGNDAIGDCTIAGLAHAQTVYRGLIGALCIWGQADVERLYYQLTGGPDSGLALLTVLQHWHRNPINHDRILGFVSVDPRDHEHVRQAIQVFGGLYIGFAVTQETIAQFESGQPWTPAPLIEEGHCVFVEGYDPNTLNVLTWGAAQQGTWAWWDACVDEAYAIVPPEASNASFAPGYNLAALLADLAALKDAA